MSPQNIDLSSWDTLYNFIKYESSLPRSQDPPLDLSQLKRTHILIPYLLKIHLHIILSFISTSL
jgi:hypothetical protein